MRILFPYDGYENLGIGYLSSVARRDNHSIELVPLGFGDYIRGHRNLSARNVEQAASAITAAQPDIVAFSLNSFTAEDHGRIARELRKRGVKTIAGGPHATAEPILTIQSQAYDALITHEAESVFAEALEFVSRPSVTRPAWISTPDHPESSRPELPDLEKLPFPDKDLFFRYSPFEAGDYKIVTARGCPFHCIFCAPSSAVGGRSFRRRSVDSVLRELMWAKECFRPSTVYFLDDVFTLQPEWLREFLPEYKKKVGLPFHAISHPSCFSEEVAELLRSAGCFKIRFGVQSLTPRVKEWLGRAERAEDVAEAIRCARRARMSVEVDHMVNVPGESLEDARDGILFYNEHRPDSIKAYWLTPLPGTPWFSQSVLGGTVARAEAERIKRGEGFGRHSYLFYGHKSYQDRRWLGIHFLLLYSPLLPKTVVRFLVRIKADRFFRIPSFTLLVGVSRLLTILRGNDRVGEAHLMRLWNRLRTN